MNWVPFTELRRLGRVLLCVVLLGVPIFSVRGAEKESPPRIASLIRAGQETLQKFRKTPAAWRVRCRMPNGFAMETKVVHDGDRRVWSFGHVVDGKVQLITRVVQREGLWYVIDSEMRAKYRPYEAVLRLPGSYMLLSLAEPRCLSDKNELKNAQWDQRRGRVTLFRLPLPEETRPMVLKSIEGLEQLEKQDPASLKPESRRNLELMREYVTKGIPLGVDETTGMIVECRLQDVLVTFEEFRWLEAAADKDFAVPNRSSWEDHSTRWSADALNDCVMVQHDPLFQVGGKSLAGDTCLLNLKTGSIRRVPFEGMVSMPGCFLPNRHELVVPGTDINGPVGLVKLDLNSGLNTVLEPDASEGRISLMAELSPDGKSVATMQMSGSGQILDFQIRTVDRASGRSRLIGKPARIGAPFSWLPDGDGFILKRFVPAKDPRAIEPTILCRLNLDGKLTDLRPGDSPLVLRKSGRILYEDNASGLWNTCALDGTEPKLFADGLAHHASPAVSPDETRIIFCYYQDGKRPELRVFELGKSRGTPIITPHGFTVTPIWR